MPFLLPLAAAGALELIDVATRARTAAWRDAARPALDLALLAGAGLAVTLPCYSAAEVRQQDSAIEYNLGVAATRWSESTHAEHLRLAGAAAARESQVQAARQASRAAAYLEEATQSSPGFFAAEVEWAIARERRASYLAEAGEYARALGDYLAARRRLGGALTAMTSGSSAGAGRSGSSASSARARTPPSHQGVDPELESEAHTVLAALDAGAAGALNNLGVQLIAAGQLERAQTALAQAVALAPGQPAPRGSLALCWFQRGLAARAALGRGAAAAAARLFASSRDGYRQAIQLADAAGRTDLAGLYRRGLAAAEAELARDRKKP